ncbi:DUF2180 family protein [Amycolatopsis sp. CA-161197]|uniref:DUF2180 family protein n=1 Tax=unclassified Amycolatopsis TaxID=2618356 RepID=UPI0034559C36
MICIDCTETDTTTPAIGCCVHCGGATCKSHAVVQEFEAAAPGVLVAKRARRAVMCARCGAPQVVASKRKLAQV